MTLISRVDCSNEFSFSQLCWTQVRIETKRLYLIRKMFAIPSFFYLVSTVLSAVYTIHRKINPAHLWSRICISILYDFTIHLQSLFTKSKLYLVKLKEWKDANATTSYWIFIPILFHTHYSNTYLYWTIFVGVTKFAYNSRKISLLKM